MQEDGSIHNYIRPASVPDPEKNSSRPRYSLCRISAISSGVSLQPFCNYNLIIFVIPLLKNAI